jgi:hypothetical protein
MIVECERQLTEPLPPKARRSIPFAKRSLSCLS